MGGICVWLYSGCGCKEVYRFPHITYPYSSCIYVPFKNIFFFLVPVLFVIKFYVLNTFSHSINTHIYRRLQASHGLHMKGCT